MKTMKKTLSLVLAIVMALALAMPAYAATGDYVVGGETTITATDVHEGDSVAYYQVVEWVEGTGWAITEAFSGVDGLTVEALTASTGITDELAAKIAAKASGDGTPMTAGDPATTFTATVTPGLYYLKASPTTSVDVVYNPAFVSADYSEGGNTVSFSDTIGSTAVLKSSTIDLTKEVDTTRSNGDLFKDTKPGDIIPFTISTQIPSYGDTFVHPVFSISDTLNGGLKLKIDGDHPFQVAYGENTASATNSNVTFTDVQDGKTSFTVAFTESYLTGLAGAQPEVTITYWAEVGTEALDNVTYMDNQAVLTYSNTPNTTDSKDDITRHYTFSIDGNLLGGTGSKTDELIKIGVNADGSPITETTTTYHETAVSPLSGATFTLTPIDGTPGEAKTNVTSATGGYITFTGLDAGKYTLVETAAPAGFIKDDRTFTVEIVPHWNADEPDLLDSYDIIFTNDKDSTTTTASFTMTNTGETKATTGSAMPTAGEFVKNTRGTELPSTGGIGTKVFYTMGAVLVVGAGVVLVSRKRAGE